MVGLVYIKKAGFLNVLWGQLIFICDIMREFKISSSLLHNTFFKKRTSFLYSVYFEVLTNYIFTHQLIIITVIKYKICNLTYINMTRYNPLHSWYFLLHFLINPFKSLLQKLLQPFAYILQVPGKQIRAKLAHAFNYWLKIRADKLLVVGDIVQMLHNSSLL
jgi:hypothetical protein